MSLDTSRVRSVEVVRPQPRPPLLPFYVCGAVLGGRLPDEAVIADVVLVKRQGPEWYDRQLRPPSDLEVTANGANAFLVRSPDWRAKSEWSIHFRVDAVDDDEAIARVQDKLAPVVKVALESISESTVQIELLWWGLEGEDGLIPESWSVWPAAASGQPYEISQASGDDVAIANRAAHAVLSSDPLAEAARELYVAQRLFNRIDGSLEATVAAFHRYFVVIERLAGKSGKKPHEAELARIVDSLRTSLNSPRGLRRSISAIDAAHSQVREANGRHLVHRIRATGKRLELSDEIIESAIALLKVRNATTHPGFDGSVQDVYEHVMLAQRIARTFMQAAAGKSSG